MHGVTLVVVTAFALAGCGGSEGPSGPGTTPEPETGTLRGRVLAAADSPVAGVAIAVQRSGHTSRSATTTSTGTYTVADLAAGSWSVSVTPGTGYEADGPLTASVSVAAGTTVDAPVLRLRRSTAPPAPSFAQVNISDNAFTPQTVTVAVNGTVRWTNGGAALHNTTASGTWASPNLANGATFERVFPAAGTFNYECTLHAGMTGTVVVR